VVRLIQFVLIGIGLGSAYALFAQGVVLIYRGSGLVNFAHGALGMLAAYVTFDEMAERRGLPIELAALCGIAAAVAAALLFQLLVLRHMTRASPLTRVISTLGLLAVLQSGVELRYGNSNRPVEPFLPHRTFDWGGVRVEEQRIYIVAVTCLITLGFWAFTRYTRAGLATTASAENERAVQTLGWSPNGLAMLTWGIGAGAAGIAGVLVAPLTGLSTVTFTVVLIASLAAALLGGFRSFPLTLLGGLIIGIGEAVVSLYRANIEDFLGVSEIRGLERCVPFLVILVVLVVRGRGLPLRSHISDRLPRLGTGKVSYTGLAIAVVVVVALVLLVFDDSWAAATYISMASAMIVLSVVVLTGYTGQLSLGQWAVAGLGTMIAALFVLRLGVPVELAIPIGIVLSIPAGLVFALPALRTRGVNLAVVTLGLGFTISSVVFANGSWVSEGFDGGTRIVDEGEKLQLFGIEVDSAGHPHRWAIVSIVAFTLCALCVANLRRSRTGRRLLAVRTNERAAASIGINVFSVKLYSFGVASMLATVGGIVFAFKDPVVIYEPFNVFASINAVSYAVIGGVGFVVGAAISAPNAIGGIGTRVMDDLVHIGRHDVLVGGILLLVILITHQDGVAAVASDAMRPLFSRLRLTPRTATRAALPSIEPAPVDPATLTIDGLAVRYGGVLAVDDVSFEVHPGEVVGLIGPNGAGKTSVIDAVTGFTRASRGTIQLAGDDITAWSASRRARARIRRSFQSLELFDDISVEDNIRAGAESSRAIDWVTDLVWPVQSALPATAVAAIRQFELESALGQLPGELPYGQRRLIAIARAVASGPSVILLDEPAAGLDETESRELAALIRRLADQQRMAVLLVEHDVGLVMSTCDRIVVIDFGRVVASGTPAEIRVDPVVRAAYLGEHDESSEMPDVAVS
jgi:sulfate-transporting ATPase